MGPLDPNDDEIVEDVDYENYDTEIEEDEDDLILQRWEGDDS